MKTRKLDDPALMRTASDWLSRLRQPSTSAEDVSEWRMWYESDDRNKQAYEDARSFWDQAGALQHDGQFMARVERELSDSQYLANRASHRGSWNAVRERVLAWLSSRHLFQTAAFAATLAAVIVAVQSYWDSPELQVVTLEGPRAFGTVRSIAAGTRPSGAPELVKEAYLSDGSQVALAEKSSVSVKFTKEKRYLEMSPGIAFFTVAHNRSRPFIVKVGNFYVRAVGTAFNIRSNDARLVVTVTQGTVDVYPVDQSDAGDVPDADIVKANAGREVAWSRSDASPSVTSVNTSLALAWETGVLQYLNEPLGSAIEDVRRYSDHTITVQDPAIMNFLVSGTVFTNSTDAWLKSLPRLFPLRVSVDGSGNYIIESRPPVPQT